MSDSTTGRITETFTGDPTYEVAFSPDGTKAAGGGQTGARVWDAATGRDIATRTGSRTDTIAFNPNGTILAIGTGDPGRGRPIRVPRNHRLPAVETPLQLDPHRPPLGPVWWRFGRPGRYSLTEALDNPNSRAAYDQRQQARDPQAPGEGPGDQRRAAPVLDLPGLHRREAGSPLELDEKAGSAPEAAEPLGRSQPS
ncbi:WD40 repeat domain-containing protein [Kitasatospora sp. NPDC050543]|uniref:WD40 repeat domain-containing protein n=1 Tax=Kitasatospora sp. NPDC050543 TaxID=3364054 RepID=UPI0037B49197